MSNKAHASPIAALLFAVTKWRTEIKWTRENVATEVVKAHNAIGGPARTGVEFEWGDGAKDTFKRSHADAVRIFRWLDDDKDTNLLSANMLPSVLAALPEDMRVHFLKDYLRPLGLDVKSIDQSQGALPDMSRMLCEVMKEGSEGAQALAEAAANPSPANVARAMKELDDAERSFHEAKLKLEPAVCAPVLKAVRSA